MDLDDFNINADDKIYLIILLLFSIILTGYYIFFNENLGIYCSDVFIYLLNALYFTGNNIHSTSTIYLSPVICFLTSVLFYAGFVDKLSIYIVTGVFAVIGNIGLYILLKSKFDNLLSITGTILYSTFSLTLTWLANGTLDVPAVSITVWTVLLTMTAVNRNNKYYVYAIPLFVLGFFTRYTVVLILPVLLLYYLYKKGFRVKRNDLKPIGKGIIIAVILALIILIPVLHMGEGNMGAGGQIANGISGQQGSQDDPALNSDITYYIMNLGNFLSASHVEFIKGNPALSGSTILSAILFTLLLIGLAFKLKDIKPDKQYILPTVLFLIAILTYTSISSAITIILSFIGLYLLGRTSKSKTGFVMFGWIMVYFTFFSYYNIKVNRYIIPVFPPLVYFILSAVELIHDHIHFNKKIIPIALIILFTVQGFCFTLTFDDVNPLKSSEEMSDYIISNVSDYKDDIAVYNIRPYSWYLHDDISGITTDNIGAIEDSNFTYYVSNKELKLTNYREIKRIDDIYLYERLI